MRRTAGLFIMSIAGCPVGETAPPDTALDTSTSGTLETSSGASSSSTATDPITDATGSDATRADTSNGVEPDHPPPLLACDLFAQDCPRGYKCTGWADQGGPQWTDTRCVPVVDDPAGLGEACTVQDHPWSGIDDCDHGLVCWAVGDDLVGRCEDWCTGSADNPQCAAETDTCTICGSGCWSLCLPICDPLAQDCVLRDEVCLPVNEDWICAPDTSGDLGGPGDPCDWIGGCDPGLVCIGATAFTSCFNALGCCSPVCNLIDPESDAMCAALDSGQSCEPWYAEGNEPRGYEHVGVCAVPQ